VCNVDPFDADAYVHHYWQKSPLVPVAATIAPGKVRTHTPITQTDRFRASAFFHESGPATGMGGFRRDRSSSHAQAFEQLRLMRSPDAIWVEPAEWQLLETLAPHLQRAAAIHDLLSRARATTESLGAAVAAAGFAVFLLSGDRRVVFANAKAEDLLPRQMGLQYASGLRRRRASTRRAFSRKPEPAVRRSSSAGSSRPPCSARRILTGIIRSDDARAENVSYADQPQLRY
jgi:PAS domain-containing protein